MSSRLAAMLAVSLALLLCAAGFGSIEAAPRSPATAKPAPEARDPAASSPARERQRRCGAEWRGLSAAERTAKGPTWPKFYSRCVKRLKDPHAKDPKA